MAAFAQFGSDLDVSTQKLLNRGSKLTELLKQNQYSPLTVAEQVVSIFTGVSGYLDDIELNKIKKFESDLLEKISNDHPDILENINTSGKLEDEIKNKLVEIIELQKKVVNNAKFRRFKKRIKSVKSTQKITKAMKMVAAAKLKKAQENAEKGRPYSDKLQNIILNLTKSISDETNAPKLLAGNGKDNIYLCVVITADRGLCGGFNSNICKLAKNYFKNF